MGLDRQSFSEFSLRSFWGSFVNLSSEKTFVKTFIANNFLTLQLKNLVMTGQDSTTKFYFYFIS
jgi:hypothetical protein